MFDFAEAKALLRRTVHSTFGVPGFYQDLTMLSPEELRIRWHNKIARFGDLESEGYSQVIEGIERVVFDRAELVEKGIVLVRRGQLTVTAADGQSAVLSLDSMEPRVGPIEEIWMVSKQ